MLITKRWVQAQGGATYYADHWRVNLEAAGNRCAAFDRFVADVAADIRQSRDTTQAAFRDASPIGPPEYVTEAIIPAGSAAAQQAAADAKAVPGACRRSRSGSAGRLAAQPVDSPAYRDPSLYAFTVSAVHPTVTETIALTYARGRLIVTKWIYFAEGDDFVAVNAAECSASGGPKVYTTHAGYTHVRC
jgi:hypothetical protein